MIGIGAGFSLAFSAYMVVPELLRIFGLDMNWLQGTGLGKSLLGIPDKEFIEKIEVEEKKIGTEDALVVAQKDQILQKREMGREAIAHAKVGQAEGDVISDLDRQIRALRIGGRTNPLEPKDDPAARVSVEPDVLGPEGEPLRGGRGPTAEESLLAEPLAAREVLAGTSAPRPTGPLGAGEGEVSLLTQDEREDIRNLMIEVGLPQEA